MSNIFTTIRTPYEVIAPGQPFVLMAVTVIAFLTASLVVQGVPSQLFLLVCLFISVMTFSSERFGLVLLFVLSFYALYVRAVLSVPHVFVNLVYVILLILAVRQFSPVILNKKPLPRTSFDYIFFVLFALIAVSFLLNRPPVGPAVKSVILHTFFFLLFYALAHSNISESVLKKLTYGIFVVALIQVAASSIQYFYVFADMPRGFRHDKSAGLFGWSAGSINAVFMVYVFSLVLGFIKVYGTRLLYLLYLFLLVVPIVLSSAIAGFIFFVLTGMFLLVMTPLVRGRLLQRDIGQLKGLTVFFAVVISLLGAGYLPFLTSPQAIVDYSMGKQRLGRLGTMQLAHETTIGSPVTLIFGQGPGQLMHTQVGAIGEITESEFREEYGEEARSKHSFLHISLDLGYGGLLLFLFIHYKLFMLSRMVFRGVDDRFWQAIALGFCGVVFTSAYSIVYTQTWLKPALLFPFWLLAGSLYRLARIKGIVAESRREAEHSVCGRRFS